MTYQDADGTFGLFLEVIWFYHHIRDGAEECLYARLRSLDMWQNSQFWEQHFISLLRSLGILSKLEIATAACCRMYPNVIDDRLIYTNKPEDIKKFTDKEQHEIVNLLSDLGTIKLCPPKSHLKLSKWRLWQQELA